MRETANRGDRIAIYGVDEMNGEEASKSNSQYIMQVAKDKFLDAE